MTSRRRTRARKYISLREKLAAALSMLLPQAQRDELRAARVPAKSVIALFDQDHAVLHALGGEDRWWNLTPMLRAVHREKASRDTSIVAKSDRLVKEREAHQAAMRRKLLGPSPFAEVPQRRGWPSRKLRSRSSFERRGNP